MLNRKVLATIVLLAATVASVASSAAAAAAAPASCMLREHRIIGVAPYVVESPRGPREIHEGRAAARELRGATVFVQAEPGLTAEWLQQTLSRQLGEMQGGGDMKACAFGMNDIQIKATSGCI
jgi:ABC-type sugar transport system substrate-binding protein